MVQKVEEDKVKHRWSPKCFLPEFCPNPEAEERFMPYVLAPSAPPSPNFSNSLDKQEARWLFAGL
ncbi:MAG: hypothetical protein D6743_05965 [Calditrichaeota bacterium]|nr:MAG: hypothetical protein D6743_05965 [Calditrichota bacterium]